MFDQWGMPYFPRVRYNSNPHPCQFFGVIDRHSGHRRECYGAAKKGRRYCNRHQMEERKLEEAMKSHA